jgi:hypothetical protein
MLAWFDMAPSQGALSALGLVAPAVVDPGNGTRHPRTLECFPEPGLYTICVEQKMFIL